MLAFSIENGDEQTKALAGKVQEGGRGRTNISYFIDIETVLYITMDFV